MPTARLLDTDHCIAYLNPRSAAHATVAARINVVPVSELYFATFTALELAEGPFHSPTAQSRSAQQAALDAFRSLLQEAVINDLVILEFGRIRAELRQRGRIIGNMDIGIAATALVYDLTLVTHNTSDCQRISGLRLEDWFP